MSLPASASLLTLQANQQRHPKNHLEKGISSKNEEISFVLPTE